MCKIKSLKCILFIMFNKKKVFFYIFYTSILTSLGHYFYIFFPKAFNIIKLDGFKGLLNNVIYISYIVFILLLLMSFSYGIIKILKKEEYLIVLVISFLLMNIINIILTGLTFDLLYLTYFGAISFVFIYFFLYYNKKTPIHKYINCFFCLIVFSFLTIGILFLTNNNEYKNSAESINDLVLESNLIVLDILNNNSIQILTPYLNHSYSDGYNAGYITSCIDNLADDCSKISPQNITIAKYLNRNLVLFNKEVYKNQLSKTLNEKIPATILKLSYLLFISFILFVFSFFSPVILFVLYFLTKQLIRFFVWFFDPFGTN